MLFKAIPEEQKYEKAFKASRKKHILMITNHGVHQWKVVPGLPDTGGQNVFVNQFTNQLAASGYRVTIINRGGYKHPVTGDYQQGVLYRDEQRRILYIEDSTKEFVRKEDMPEHVLPLTHFLHYYLLEEKIKIDLIVSHYWDAAKIGIELNQRLAKPVKHIWVPHSLGALKKKNMESSKWQALRIDERIEIEKSVVPFLDGLASTSNAIRDTMAKDYKYKKPLYLPPCIHTERYHKHDVASNDPVWDHLSQCSTLEPREIQKCKIITEISRTDKTKRKDVLIKAFIKAHKKNQDSFLIVSIDPQEQDIYKELKAMVESSGVSKHIAIVGSIWALLPVLYSITDIYCTPSVMEGFGMSAQEAAATQVPVIASDLVPYVVEFLMGKRPRLVKPAGGKNLVRVGPGGIVVKADDIGGFAFAMDMLLKDNDLRAKMGRKAFKITIPYFSWDNMVNRLLKEISFK